MQCANFNWILSLLADANHSPLSMSLWIGYYMILDILLLSFLSSEIYENFLFLGDTHYSLQE